MPRRLAARHFLRLLLDRGEGFRPRIQGGHFFGLRGFVPAEQSIDEARRAGAGIPSQPEDRQTGRATAEFVTGLIAIPHVNVDMPSLHGRSGIHDRVDTVVSVTESIDLDDRTDREQIRVGRSDAVPDVDP